jgi:hypothetical protein
MTGICVCCSLTLEDIALDSNTDIIIDLLTFLTEHKNIYMLSGRLISLGDLTKSLFGQCFLPTNFKIPV